MNNQDEVFEIERTPEFFEAAEALSAFVVGLNLSTKKNKELVRPVCAQVHAAEKGGFAYGIKVGIAIKEADLTIPRDVRGFLS